MKKERKMKTRNKNVSFCSICNVLSSPHKAQAPTGRPREARTYNKLRREHTRALRFNVGLKNIHFKKEVLIRRYPIYVSCSYS